MKLKTASSQAPTIPGSQPFSRIPLKTEEVGRKLYLSETGMLLAIFGFPIVTAQLTFNNDLLTLLSQGSEAFG
jgi:hypothetical protein